MWKNSKLFRLGMIGSVVTAICCFTPIIVVLFGLLGLAGFLTFVDFVLFPVLALFVGITVYAYVREHNKGSRKHKGDTS